MAFQNLKGTGIGYLLGKLKTYLDETYQKIVGAVLTINGEEPDEYGNVQINRVNMAGDLESSQSQSSSQSFIQRTSGGAASIDNGDAWLSIVRGNSERTGYVAEQRDFTVNPADDEAQISATIDWDTFLEQVTETSVTTFTYTTGWNLNPANYGITVTGTPTNGDEIIVDYVKEERGLITNATPESFISTGWNLYRTSGDYTGYTGYAKVVKYSDDYGYMIKGSRTGIQFSATLGGEKIALADVDGLFQIPSDGYVWVVGGSSANTAIYPTWSDWTSNYAGDFTAYSQSVIDISDVMDTYFPNGLCKVESTYDEINLSLGTVTVRIEQQEYTEDNLIAARASGRAFTYDTDYIYIVKESITPVSISGLSGQYSVNDHGLEYFNGTTVAVDTHTIYGANLKNKLERDVLTKSQQSLSNSEKKQARDNIGAISSSDVQKISVPNNSTVIATDVSIATATDTTISAITLNKGINLCVFTVNWASNANGYRTAWIAASNDGGHLNLASQVTDGPSPSGIRQQLTIVRNVTSATETLYIRVKQTSGSALKCSVRLARILFAQG